jgi:hypothetical protein
MLEFFKILADSWPIAWMVLGITAAVVIRKSFKQAMDNDRAEKLDRAQGNNAVVVQNRREEDC